MTFLATKDFFCFKVLPAHTDGSSVFSLCLDASVPKSGQADDSDDGKIKGEGSLGLSRWIFNISFSFVANTEDEDS